MIITTTKRPTKAQFLTYDTLDDRREIHTLLSRLHPFTAIRWLDQLCQQINIHGSRPGPSRAMRQRAIEAARKGGEHHRRLVNEIYMDVWMICSQYGLDIDQAVKRLEEMVKQIR